MMQQIHKINKNLREPLLYYFEGEIRGRCHAKLDYMETLYWQSGRLIV